MNTLAPTKRTAGQRLRRLVFLLAFAYLVVLIVMLFLENRLVYPLQTAAEHWEEPPDPAIEEVTFPSNGVTIHGWYLPQPGSDEVMLLCHGNGGNLSYRGNSLLRFREHLGCSVLIFDYPGYGKNAGRPSEAGCYDSAEAALKWLSAVKKIPVEGAIVYGESLGGGVATEIARRHPIRALVLLKTFTTLPAVGQMQYRWLPVNWLMRNRFDSLSKIAAVRCPVFVSSAVEDQTVPFQMGEVLYQAAPEPKQFFALEHEGHNDRVSDEFMTTLRRFLDQHKPPR